MSRTHHSWHQMNIWKRKAPNSSFSHSWHLATYHSIHLRYLQWPQSQSDTLYNICRIPSIWWVYMRNLGFLILTISSRTQTCQVQHKQLHHTHTFGLKDRFLSQRHKYSILSSYLHSLFSQSSLHTTSSTIQTIRWPSLLTCRRIIQSILPHRKNQRAFASSRHRRLKLLRIFVTQKSNHFSNNM